jgi:hypothetical protein
MTEFERVSKRLNEKGNLDAIIIDKSKLSIAEYSILRKLNFHMEYSMEFVDSEFDDDVTTDLNYITAKITLANRRIDRLQEKLQFYNRKIEISEVVRERLNISIYALKLMYDDMNFIQGELNNV